jgi:hypothetical protein
MGNGSPRGVLATCGPARTGQEHSLFLLEVGRVFICGPYHDGQLGLGPTHALAPANNDLLCGGGIAGPWEVRFPFPTQAGENHWHRGELSKEYGVDRISLFWEVVGRPVSWDLTLAGSESLSPNCLIWSGGTPPGRLRWTARPRFIHHELTFPLAFVAVFVLRACLVYNR